MDDSVKASLESIYNALSKRRVLGTSLRGEIDLWSRK